MRRSYGGIPSLHLGTRFRSATEARWAEFLYSQGIKWSYEPKAIGNGEKGYLVDFQLTEAKSLTYLEVKPTPPTRQEYEFLVQLAKCEKAHCFVTHGPPAAHVVVEKVFSDGRAEQWFFAYEQGGRCGYLVDSLYAGTYALPLRKGMAAVAKYGVGPAGELDRAGSYQFSNPLAPRRVKASPELKRKLAEQIAAEQPVEEPKKKDDAA
jgi:hypothetical protein